MSYLESSRNMMNNTTMIVQPMLRNPCQQQTYVHTVFNSNQYAQQTGYAQEQIIPVRKASNVSLTKNTYMPGNGSAISSPGKNTKRSKELSSDKENDLRIRSDSGRQGSQNLFKGPVTPTSKEACISLLSSQQSGDSNSDYFSNKLGAKAQKSQANVFTSGSNAGFPNALQVATPTHSSSFGSPVVLQHNNYVPTSHGSFTMNSSRGISTHQGRSLADNAGGLNNFIKPLESPASNGCNSRRVSSESSGKVKLSFERGLTRNSSRRILYDYSNNYLQRDGRPSEEFSEGASNFRNETYHQPNQHHGLGQPLANQHHPRSESMNHTLGSANVSFYSTLDPHTLSKELTSDEKSDLSSTVKSQSQKIEEIQNRMRQYKSSNLSLDSPGKNQYSDGKMETSQSTKKKVEELMERYGRINSSINHLSEIKKIDSNINRDSDLSGIDDSRTSINESFSRTMTSKALVKSGRTVFGGSNTNDFYQSKYSSSSFILTPSSRSKNELSLNSRESSDIDGTLNQDDGSKFKRLNHPNTTSHCELTKSFSDKEGGYRAFDFSKKLANSSSKKADEETPALCGNTEANYATSTQSSGKKLSATMNYQELKNALLEKRANLKMKNEKPKEDAMAISGTPSKPLSDGKNSLCKTEPHDGSQNYKASLEKLNSGLSTPRLDKLKDIKEQLDSYKKLQDKLNNLESKIQKIRTNIDSSESNSVKRSIEAKLGKKLEISSTNKAEGSVAKVGMSHTENSKYGTSNSDSSNKKEDGFSFSNLVTQVNLGSPKSLGMSVNKTLAASKIPRNFLNNDSYHIYYVSSVVRAFGELHNEYFNNLMKDHFMQTVQAISFIKNLKPLSEQQIEERKVQLPDKKDERKTLVFDLDETLIHCSEQLDLPHDVIIPIEFPNGVTIEAGINVRPYVKECLTELKQYYEIVVFTASHSCYANKVLDFIDPNKDLIEHRFFREHCVPTEEGIYIKDLRIFGNRNLDELTLVDNAAYSFGFQIENGIPVIPYYDNKEDLELLHLTNYLKGIHKCKDIREPNRNTFKLQLFMEPKDPFELINLAYGKFSY